MSKYNEIRDAVSQLVAEYDAYWDSLYNVFGTFHSQYRNFLGLTDEVLINQMGERCPVLQTGLFDDEAKKIVPHAPFALNKDGKKLCFDMVLNLCAAGTLDVKISKLIEVKFRKENENFIFEVVGLQGEYICKATGLQVDFTPFFNALHERLLQQLVF